jgi:hypothetical protein
MLEVLMFGGVQIHQAKEDFQAEGRLYPAGSFVVKLSQPYKPYAWALLERQKYPDIRQYPGGPPVPPYDNAAWTLPLQMGVACDEVKTPFEAKLEKLDKAPVLTAALPDGADFFALDCRKNASYALAFGLLKAGAAVSRSKGAFQAGQVELPAGSFIVKNTPEAAKALEGLLAKWPVTAVGLADVSGIPAAPLQNPRIGLYQSWRSNMDEGWTRYIFDDMGIAFTTLHNSDIKPPKDKKGQKPDLRAKYDVIVFADENPDIILSGKPSPTSEFARYFRQFTVPPEYEGGIEKEGVEALKAFVQKGGIIITLNEACDFASRELSAPARNALEHVERTKFFCPTSILKLEVDNTTPIGYGMPEEAAAMFSDSVALDTWIPPNEWDHKVVARFPKDNILLSGWLLGEDVISRKAAVVDTQYQKGRIVLIGIRCQHRAESHGTYKFLLNALLYPRAD